MLNNVTLIGRLTEDPDLKYTQNSKAVCNLTLAVDRGYGEKKVCDFFPVVVWEQNAEFAANFLKKGNLVAVNGELQIRSWEAQDGGKRRTTEICARTLKNLTPKSRDDEAPESRGDRTAAKTNGKPAAVAAVHADEGGDTDGDQPFFDPFADI